MNRGLSQSSEVNYDYKLKITSYTLEERIKRKQKQKVRIIPSCFFYPSMVWRDVCGDERQRRNVKSLKRREEEKGLARIGDERRREERMQYGIVNGMLKTMQSEELERF